MGRGRENIGELLRPGLLDTEGQCVGKELFEELRGPFWRVLQCEPLGLGYGQIFFKAEDLVAELKSRISSAAIAGKMNAARRTARSLFTA